MSDRKREDQPLALEKDEGAIAEPLTLRTPSPAPALPPSTEPVKTAEPPATARDEGTTRYRRCVLLTLSTIVLALVLCWASGYVFAYTDDAYVTSDLIGVAPQVSGRIVAVNFVDNQPVKQGTVLAMIDPTPFQLTLKEKQAKRTEAEAQLAVDRDTIASAQASRDEATARSGWRATICAARCRSRAQVFCRARRSTRPRRSGRRRRPL
jgi:multidrug efflux system membrane fusion protein